MRPLDLATIRSQFPERRIDWLDSVDSTMLSASRLAAARAPSGTVVGAEEQISGRGRYGRPWHSPRSAGLYFSEVLRFPFAPATLPLVTLALGLATADSVRAVTSLQCDLRWPNDVLIDGRKCAGILLQLEGAAIIAGIGLNVNHDRFPPQLVPIATSLRIESGHPHPREPLLIELLRSIDSFCELLATQGKQPILDLFTRSSSYVLDRRVQVDQEGSALVGVTEGLTESGFLLLRDDAGQLHTLMAGGVRPCSQ